MFCFIYAKLQSDNVKTIIIHSGSKGGRGAEKDWCIFLKILYTLKI